MLIHEGGADSGHYYSYTYDFQSGKWRKYNDINISEEVEEQKGVEEQKDLVGFSIYDDRTLFVAP